MLHAYRISSDADSLPDPFTDSTIAFERDNFSGQTDNGATLFRYTCATKTFAGTTYYVNPVSGTLATTLPQYNNILLTAKSVDEKTGLFGSNALNYLANGLYIIDSWQDMSSTIPAGSSDYPEQYTDTTTVTTYLCRYYKALLYFVRNGVYSVGNVVIYTTSTNVDYSTPSYPYQQSISWTVRSYSEDSIDYIDNIILENTALD